MWVSFFSFFFLFTLQNVSIVDCRPIISFYGSVQVTMCRVSSRGHPGDKYGVVYAFFSRFLLLPATFSSTGGGKVVLLE